MNYTIVSPPAKSSPFDRTSKTEKLPFVKVRSVGDGVSENFSPIVHGRKLAAKKKQPPKADPSKRKRIPWTKEEDDRLLALIQKVTDASSKHDNAVYTKVATLLNTGRSAKQCRDRWQNFLRGGIKKGDWTIDEEDLIKDLYTTFGAKWSVMAKLFPDRTDNDIKNKWYSMKRKDDRQGKSACKNPFADVPPTSNSNIVVDYSRNGTNAAVTATSDLQHCQSPRKISSPAICTTSFVEGTFIGKVTAV